MSKASRSSNPQALSVASMTEPGNVSLTVDRLLEFDQVRIGFTHARTWAAMPAARRGVFSSKSSGLMYPGTHPRVEACIRALFELGEQAPVDTKRFEEFPAAGLTTNRAIEWGPGVSINVKAVCWYVKDGVPVIPLLQPRKMAIKEEALSLYARLGVQAYAKGDWVGAKIEIVDLSGEGEVVADVIADHQLGSLSESRIRAYVDTYMQAKKIVDEIRSERPKPMPKPKSDDLLDIFK